jgi:hypothetical protein
MPNKTYAVDAKLINKKSVERYQENRGFDNRGVINSTPDKSKTDATKPITPLPSEFSTPAEKIVHNTVEMEKGVGEQDASDWGNVKQRRLLNKYN